MSREVDLPDARTSGEIAGYRLDGYIGGSDRGAVYLARKERRDRQVALKVLAPERVGDSAFRAGLLRESRAATAVGHPNIIPVYQAGDADGTVYVAMRYAPGGDTRALLNRLGPLPFALAGTIVTQVGSALDAAHAQGLIHRDVKPANILLGAGQADGDGSPAQAGRDTGQLYLSDFGMAPDTSLSEVITAGQLTGRLDYLAPEQIEGQSLDGRADLYSLACVGFELLCGTPLFEADQGLTVMYAQLYAPPPSASARRHDLPDAVDRVLATALAKNPADRYPTCTQFAQELSEALGLAGLPPARPPIAPTHPRPAGPRRARSPRTDLRQAGPGCAGPGCAGPGKFRRVSAPQAGRPRTGHPRARARRVWTGAASGWTGAASGWTGGASGWTGGAGRRKRSRFSRPAAVTAAPWPGQAPGRGRRGHRRRRDCHRRQCRCVRPPGSARRSRITADRHPSRHPGRHCVTFVIAPAVGIRPGGRSKPTADFQCRYQAATCRSRQRCR